MEKETLAKVVAMAPVALAVADVPVPAAPPGAAPTAAAVAIKISREDYLEIENVSVKAQNMAYQEARLQRDLVEANRMRRDFQAQVVELQGKLSEKYKVDLKDPTLKILEDGTVLIPPKTPAAPAKAG